MPPVQTPDICPACRAQCEPRSQSESVSHANACDETTNSRMDVQRSMAILLRSRAPPENALPRNRDATSHVDAERACRTLRDAVAGTWPFGLRCAMVAG